jgi:ribosomal protein S10
VTKLEATGATERALRTHSRVIQLEDGATRLTRQITEAKIEAEARCSSLESKIEQSDGDLQEKVRRQRNI